MLQRKGAARTSMKAVRTMRLKAICRRFVIFCRLHCRDDTEWVV
jgi:hypothetical protein